MRNRKPVRDFATQKLLKIEDAFYLVAGSKQIYLINRQKSEDCPVYARMLTPEEMGLLPFEVIYTGEEENFRTDEKEALTIIVKILELMNLMQQKQWQSYPLGKAFTMILMVNTIITPP